MNWFRLYALLSYMDTVAQVSQQRVTVGRLFGLLMLTASVGLVGCQDTRPIEDSPPETAVVTPPLNTPATSRNVQPPQDKKVASSPNAALPNPEAAPATTPSARAEPGRRPVDLVAAAITAGIQNRNPTSVGTTFSADVGKLWCWVKVNNITNAPTFVTTVWYHDETLVYRINLDVGVGQSWRTWSFMRINSGHVGAWKVEVLSPDGELLDTLPFTVEGPPPPSKPDIDAILGDPPKTLY